MMRQSRRQNNNQHERNKSTFLERCGRVQGINGFLLCRGGRAGSLRGCGMLWLQTSDLARDVSVYTPRSAANGLILRGGGWMHAVNLRRKDGSSFFSSYS